MSKKSRKRNKKILAAIGIGLGAAALSSRKKASDKAALAGTEDGKNAKADRGFNMADVANTPKKDTAKKSTGPVSTPTTIMDSMPAAPKKNPLSKRIRSGTNEVYTIKGGNTGTGNPKSLIIGDDGSYSKGDRTFPNKMSYMNRDQKPANLGLRSGGRAGYKSGGSSVKKSMGKALRGGGKVIR